MRIKALKNLLWAANTLLVLGMVAFVLIGFVFSTPSESGPVRSDESGRARPPIKPPTPGPILAFKSIYDLAISGFPPAPVVRDDKPPDEVNVPPLARTYDLLWVTIFPDPIDSYAQLVKKGQTDIVYVRVGAKIEGWKLIEVRREGSKGVAVFENSKNPDEKATLEQTLPAAAPLENGAAAGPRPIGDSGPVARANNEIPSYEDGPTREAVAVPGDPNHLQFPVEEQRWLGKHAEKIAEEANLETVRDQDTGKAIGIQVRSFNREDSTLKRYGIREGDILISINGVPMSSKAEAIQWLKGAGKGKDRYVGVVLRKGKQITLTYDVPK